MRLNPVAVVELVQAKSFPVVNKYVGVVEARRRTSLGFEISGTLLSVEVEEGEAVQEGQTLAAIDQERLEASRDELLASLVEATARKDFTEGVWERDARLVKSGAVAAQELESSLEERDSARAAVRRIEAQLASVEVDLRKSVLRAPYAGVIVERAADEGSILSPNQAVLELLETGQLEARIALPVAQEADWRSGPSLRAELPDGTEVDLPILRVLPQRDPRTQTIDVIASLAQEGLRARDGDILTVRQREEVAGEGFFLPRDALTEGNRGLWGCFLVVPDPEAAEGAHRLEPVDIELIYEYADQVFVRGPLQTGDQVLAAGLHKLAPGQRVKIARVERQSESSLSSAGS